MRWEKKQAACPALVGTFSNSVNMQSNLVQIAVISLTLSKSEQLHKESGLLPKLFKMKGRYLASTEKEAWLVCPVDGKGNI